MFTTIYKSPSNQVNKTPFILKYFIQNVHIIYEDTLDFVSTRNVNQSMIESC